MPEPTDPRPGTDGGVELRLLGSAGLVVRGRPRPLPRKAFALLAVLALTPGHVCGRERLRGLLWGGVGQDRASANLRQLLSRVARVERASACRLLHISGDMVRLETQALSVDVTDLQRRLESAVSDPDALAGAVAAYGGDLLDGFTDADEVLDDWVARERASLRAAFVQAAAAALATPALGPAARLAVARRLLAVDPTSEIGHRARIAALGETGDLAACRRAWQACVDVLRRELGVAPSGETLAVAARHLGGGPPRPAARAEEHDRHRPKLALLPPEAPFADTRARRLATALFEDLTIGLARYRSFRVLAPFSAAAIAADPAGAAGWCDYLLSSVLAERDGRPELRFRLTDAATGEVLHAGSVRHGPDALPALYTGLADRTVAALADAIDRREVSRPTVPEDRAAYRLYLEGRTFLRRTSLEAVRRARRLFREAAARAPGFAAAEAGLARTLSMEWLLRGAPPGGLLERAFDLGRRAAAADPADHRGLREQAFAALYLKRFDEALALGEEALSLNPNDADLIVDRADAVSHCGDPEAALALFARARELNPAMPPVYRWALASILFRCRRYEDAIAELDPIRDDPAVARLLAACYARSGDLDLARAYIVVARENHTEIDPDRLRLLVPNRREEDTRHLLDALRMAAGD